jgi:hypothetical protein
VRARALGTGVESRGCFAFLLLPFFFIDAKDCEITKKRQYQFWVSPIFMKYLLIQ